MVFFCKQYGLDDGALDFTGIGLDKEKFKIFSGVYTEMLANGIDGFEEIMKTNLGLAYIKVIKKLNKNKKVEKETTEGWAANFNDCYQAHMNNTSGQLGS